MLFTETSLPGAYVIDIEPRGDARGFFARTFCVREMEAHGLTTNVVQTNISLSRTRGTVRGMHYQAAPAQEAKLIRCIHGAIYDVIVDVRPDSPTYLKHIGVELTSDNRRSLFVPEGFAHGFQTLTDDAEVLYQVSAFYTPECERGLRHDDPALGIQWPLPVTVVSEKDGRWPLLGERAA
jgi:dTDP-4-dehydrorhamnose 3,5-epimerase